MCMTYGDEYYTEILYGINQQGVGRPHSGDCDEGRRNRLEMMRTSSPAFVLRTRALEQAVKAAEQGGEQCAASHEYR